MEMDLVIRNEREEDVAAVDELTREAFWNLYVPGCDEHYLVHVMRQHPDFIPSLDFVAVHDGRIIGNIMYTKSHVIDESGERLDTLTFGPISVSPEFQRKGVGSALIRHTAKLAAESGVSAIIITGHPHNYCKHGFKCSKDFGISDSDGKFPYGLLVLELIPGAFSGHLWRLHLSDVYELDPEEMRRYDATLPPKNKEYRYTQEEYSMACRAIIE
jgi:putative acetyltransferase